MSKAPVTRNPDSSADVPSNSLWQSVARSVRDNIIAEFLGQAIRLGGFVLLARKLGPDEFGIFRVLLVVCVLATLTNNSGLADALVQRKEITPAHEATAWWLTVLLAMTAAITLYFIAPLIERAMAMPRLGSDARLLCIPIIIDATAVVSSSRLRRRLNFGALATADVMSELSFIVVALLVFWRGMPLWSLPAGLAARTSTRAIVIWIAEPHFPRALPTIRAARDFSRFATAAWGSGIVYILSSNADYILVGRFLGSAALGFYGMAWDLLRFVPDRLHRVAGRVAFPAFCQLQDDTETLARAYVDFFDYIARVVLPIAACAAIAAPEILRTIYGPQWIPSALPMRLLAPGLALSGLRLGIGSVYYSRNRPALDMLLHGVRLTLLVVTVVGVSRWGLFGVSLGMSAVEGAVSVLGQALACELIGLRLWNLAVAAIPAIRIMALCALATFVGRTAALLAIPDKTFSDSSMVLLSAVIPTALIYLWIERARAADLLGRAFAPAGGVRAKASQAQA